MNLLLKASEERNEFYDLIGTDITFGSEILSIGGAILHAKGEKAFISDVEYTPRYWSRFFNMYIEPKISTFRINGINAVCWRPDTFIEHKTKQS